MARPREAKCPNCGALVPDNAGNGFWTLRANMHDDVRPVWEAARMGLEREGLVLHRSPRMANGQVVEMLAAAYVASGGLT